MCSLAILAILAHAIAASGNELTEECSQFINTVGLTSFEPSQLDKVKIQDYVRQNNKQAVVSWIWLGASESTFSGSDYDKLWQKIALEKKVILASMSGNLVSLKNLLENHAQVNIVTVGEGWLPPLVSASKCGQVEAVSMLLSFDADPNIGGYNTSSQGISENSTALRWAAANGSSAIVKMLLKAGADPDGRETSISITSPRARSASR